MFKWALPECYHIFLCVYGIQWSFISFSHLILNGELFQSFYTCHYVICRVWQYGHSAAKTRHWICTCELSRKSWVLCRHLLSWNCLKPCWMLCSCGEHIEAHAFVLLYGCCFAVFGMLECRLPLFFSMWKHCKRIAVILALRSGSQFFILLWQATLEHTWSCQCFFAFHGFGGNLTSAPTFP